MKNSPLKCALGFAQKGWAVFALAPGQKTPLMAGNWREYSTSDTEQVSAWIEKYPDANFGIDCGKSGLWVLDVDVADGKPGLDTLAELEMLYGDLPETFVVKTRSGGTHHYFQGPGQTHSRPARGLDARGQGGYVVGPGSIVGAGEYKVETDAPLAPAPKWLQDWFLEEARGENKAQIEYGESVLTAEQIIEKASKAHNADKFLVLFRDGDLGGFDGDHSAADQGLCNMLAFWSNGDPEVMEEVFDQSALARDKWFSREDYRQRTIDTAIAGCKEFYGRRDSLEGVFSPVSKVTFEELQQRIFDSEDPVQLLPEILPEIASADLSECHRELLIKILTKRSKIGVTPLRKDLAALMGNGSDKEPDGLEIALRGVKAEFGEGNLTYTGGGFWLWPGTGVWRRVDDRLVRQAIQKHASGRERKKHVLDNALDLLKNDLHREENPFASLIDEMVVNFLNGELHWADDGWELEPHDREHYRIAQIPVDYDPTAACPRFDRFLAEVFKGDADAEDKAILIREMLGYSLLPTCRFEKFFLLIGPGANGKSVLLNVLAELVGPDCTAAVQPAQLDNRNHRASLHGKLVNIVTEIRQGHMIRDAALKSIVSGELITADRKYEHPITFRPCATLVFGTNHLPELRDVSHGMFRRAIVIPFNRVFAEEEQDKSLAEKLKAELPGIMNAALKAMAGVIHRGGFTATGEVTEATKNWRHEGDQVARFVEEECTLDPTSTVPSKSLYGCYSLWTRESGVRNALGKRQFANRLKLLGYPPDKRGGSSIICGLEPTNTMFTNIHQDEGDSHDEENCMPPQ